MTKKNFKNDKIFKKVDTTRQTDDFLNDPEMMYMYVIIIFINRYNGIQSINTTNI